MTEDELLQAVAQAEEQLAVALQALRRYRLSYGSSFRHQRGRLSACTGRRRKPRRRRGTAKEVAREARLWKIFHSLQSRSKPETNSAKWLA